MARLFVDFFAENVVEGGGRCKALVLFVISDIVRIMPTIFRQGGFRFFSIQMRETRVNQCMFMR